MKKNEKSSMKKTHTLRDTMRVTALNVTAINTMNFISYCKQREFNVSSFVTCRLMFNFTWDKVFKNGPSKICGRQPFKKLKGYGLLKQTISLQSF